jgi:hypothetical protein
VERAVLRHIRKHIAYLVANNLLRISELQQHNLSDLYADMIECPNVYKMLFPNKADAMLKELEYELWSRDIDNLIGLEDIGALA